MMRLENEDLFALRAWMAQALGMNGENYRPAFLARRLWSRMRATGTPDVPTYLALARRDAAEALTLASKFLVPTTEFFRNPEVFQALGRELVARTSRPGWATLRAVCAPCSTGEEAVSLAILLNELGLRGRIVALDRSRGALRALRSGLWPRRSMEKVDLRRRARYFREEGETSRITEDIAARIQPVCCDLNGGIPAGGVHVVMMRNFFIYLTESAQGRLLEEAARAVVPGGLLVLGRVEILPRAALGPWTLVERDARIYERTGGAG